jgi:hypothetical protein
MSHHATGINWDKIDQHTQTKLPLELKELHVLGVLYYNSGEHPGLIRSGGRLAFCIKCNESELIHMLVVKHSYC